MMRNTKIFALLLSAMLLAAPLTACGSNTDPADVGMENSSEASSEKDDPEEESDKAETTAPADESDAEDSKTTKSKAKTTAKADGKTDSKTTAKADGKTDSKTTAKADGKTEEKAETKTDAKSGGNTGNAGNNNSGGDQANQNAGGNAADPAGTAANDDPDEDAGDELKPMKYIQLSGTSAKYSGEGITVSDGLITISKGGHYEISGTLDNGQIYIMTDKKKVKLFLNNCSITNKAGSAINCQNAKKVTLYSMPGTVNYLSDGGTHDEDNGALYSEDTVVLNGEGELNITGVYAHGVKSDDDIFVKGGTINITSTKSCLHSNDGIEILAGTLFCDGGTNGIKTDGYINIMGGSSIFLGGTRDEKGSIYCGGPLTVTGGSFWAIGNTCSLPDASTTTANVIGIVFPNSQPAESIVNVTSGGNTLFTMTSPRNYKYVLYSGPNLLPNGEYSVSYGGTVSGGSGDRYVYSGGSYSGGTDGGSFTAGDTVTVHTVS